MLALCGRDVVVRSEAEVGLGGLITCTGKHRLGALGIGVAANSPEVLHVAAKKRQRVAEVSNRQSMKCFA